MIDRKIRGRVKGILAFGLRFKGVQSADIPPVLWYPPNTEQGKTKGEELLIVVLSETYKWKGLNGESHLYPVPHRTLHNLHSLDFSAGL